MIHLALVHFPTVDKQGNCVATSITNLDMHDFSRVARTYGIPTVWLIHPYEAQQRFTQRVMRHWTDGWGAAYNPTRREALEGTRLALDLNEVRDRIATESGRKAITVATSAKRFANSMSYDKLRAQLRDDPEQVYVLVFGTGWGLHPEVMQEVDLVLEPIVGVTPWNHLSVRSAMSIIVDRLIGIR